MKKSSFIAAALCALAALSATAYAEDATVSEDTPASEATLAFDETDPIADETEATVDAPAEESADSPKTGVAGVGFATGLGLVALSVGGIVASKKRKE